MKIYTSEFAHDYSTYSFGYSLHAALEDNDNPANAYEGGFLPYSADPNAHNLLYMARSVRVPVAAFVPSSENRRVFRKFDDQFTSRVLTREEIKDDAAFQKLFLDYFEARHGKSIMGKERLEGILKCALPLRGIRYETREGTIVAAVFEPAQDHWAHFWFPAYDPAYIGASLGMWLMQDAVRRTASEERTHLYLGTAYGEKARYKLNIPTLEFWNGREWQESETELKRLMNEDAEKAVACGTPFSLS